MPDVDERLADAVKARMMELRMTKPDLIKASGLTRQGLAPVLRGERRQYQDRLKIGVTGALRWTPDSIDLILAGQSPVEVEVDNGVTRLSGERSVPYFVALEGFEELAGLAADVEDLRARVRQLEAQVAGLRRRRGGPPRASGE